MKTRRQSQHERRRQVAKMWQKPGRFFHGRTRARKLRLAVSDRRGVHYSSCHSTTHEFRLSRRTKIKVPQRVAARNSSEKSARHENNLTSKLAVSASPAPTGHNECRPRLVLVEDVLTITTTHSAGDDEQQRPNITASPRCKDVADSGSGKRVRVPPRSMIIKCH